MSEPAPNPAPRLNVRRVLALAAISAALALTLTLYIGNASAPKATECPVQSGPAGAIDAAAVGMLAALNGTGEGRGFADLSFTDADGNPVTIADFRGRNLLVNFWASWCVPCREEMPELEAIAARYNGEDFLVLPISLDSGEGGLAKARTFLAEGGWPNLPLYADTTFRVFDRLKTEGVALGLPATLLLDENGCELGVLQGPAAWDSQDGYNVIDALLAG